MQKMGTNRPFFGKIVTDMVKFVRIFALVENRKI